MWREDETLAVVPGGSTPIGVDGRTDLDAVRRYRQAARSDDGFAAYLRAEVFGESEVAA